MPLRWFRFGRQETQPDAAEAAVVEEVPPPVEAVEEAAPGEEVTQAPARKRRRRGSRGGRGKKRPAGQATADVAEQAESEPAPKAQGAGGSAPAKAKPDRRPERKQQGRRRTPTRRVPLPAAKRELLITADVGEQRVAVLEDGKVAEVYLERPERRSIAGNIYLGVVDNVLPGMEAAFVEIGLEKNGFLFVDEIVGPELEGKRGARKIQDLIQRGQTVLVQAVKDPMKSKGARLTTEISLPGRFLVYVPQGDGYGVSRRIDDQERQRLKDIVKELDLKGGGIIVRTAAEGASAEDIGRDLVFLQRLWKTIGDAAKRSTAPSLVYQEAELPLRITRDLFAGDFVSVTIDDERAYKRIVGYLKKTSPHMVERVQRYKEKTPLFEAHGVDAEIESTLERRVDLPSGGYLVFDYAEAFTVVDVNTGRFVGPRGKGSAGRLEDTIVKNNLEAVTEVVRQLRLRDIGGIIVIDFIDMANPRNRATVEEALRSELERDRTKTYVVEISPLGLVEMTRQNVTEGPREILTTACAVCGGSGIVVSDASAAMDIERKLRTIAKGSRVQAFRVAVHPRALTLLAGPGGSRLQGIEASARRRFYLVPAENGHVHTDHFEVLAQGKTEDLQPETPVADGAEVELKLVEVGLYDAGAGVGKVDGYDVVVAGAAAQVGKKVTVIVGRALERSAFASLPGVGVAVASITFESEAEKPTRAPSRKAPTGALAPAAETDEAAEDAAREATEAGLEAQATEEVAEEAAEELGDAADEVAEEEGAVDDAAVEAAPKKKTRRGKRGGKRHRKKVPGTEAGADDATGSEEEPAADVDVPEPGMPEAGPEPAAARAPTRARTAKPKTTQRAPRIHVPDGTATTADGVGPGVEAQGEETQGTDGGPSVPKPGETPVKKKTRRGTRGGRKRRAPSTSGNGAGPAEASADGSPKRDGEVPTTTTATATAAPEGEKYVPMSEWLEDFD